MSCPLQSHLGSLAPEPHSSFSWAKIDAEKVSSGCWDFDINTSQEAYKHPLTKLSASLMMTPTSLEMCTEILGCETGCRIDPVIDTCTPTTHSRTIRARKTREIRKKIKHSFPPPLTSISSGSGVKVQAHRGGGRLVITAFTSSAGRVHFKSERENGRLRLFVHRNYYKQSEQELELGANLKENVGKVGRSFKCGEGSGSKNLTSLPLCVAFS